MHREELEAAPLPHLVGVRGGKAVALQEERGFWQQLIEEHTGVALGVAWAARMRQSWPLPTLSTCRPESPATHLAREQHQASVWVIEGQQRGGCDIQPQHCQRAACQGLGCI